MKYIFFIDTDWYLYFAMRNPQVTKETILKKSGALFNTRGYKATSLTCITKATGYTKGAIYRHFLNKDHLEAETLVHLSTLVLGNLNKWIEKESTAGNKLRSIFAFFESCVVRPPIKGGCPLLNSAVESDDSNPALRKKALKLMTVLRETIITILQTGIDQGQIRSGADKDFLATLIIASLEGGIMMGRLEGHSNDIRKIINHLNKQVSEIEI